MLLGCLMLFAALSNAACLYNAWLLDAVCCFVCVMFGCLMLFAALFNAACLYNAWLLNAVCCFV